MHLLSGWLWLRKWFAGYHGCALRLSGAGANAPPFVGSARARFGLAMPASWKRALEKGAGGRKRALEKGVARLCLMDGLYREAIQELGGWKIPRSDGQRAQ